MATEVEISSLDLRYESYRIKACGLDAKLLTSIAENGITESMEVVQTNQAPILLNGFKRLHCALKLGIECVPIVSLGTDEASGIMVFLRSYNKKALSIIEEARFVRELERIYGLGLAEISEQLGRSKSWVCLRLNLLKEMPEAVRAKLFGGAFPVYAYMNILRPFMRINGVQPALIESFVEALSGKKLSVREIEQLAHGCFRGPPSLQTEILKGHVSVALTQLRSVPPDKDGCDEFERILLNDLERIMQQMRRVAGKLLDTRLKSPAFFAECHLLTAHLMSKMPSFMETVRRCHDRCGQTDGGLSAPQRGDEHSRDCTTIKPESPYDA